MTGTKNNKPSPSAHAAARPFWFSAFAVILALLPLPFGANRPWASDLLGVLSALLLLLLSYDLYRFPDLWPVNWPKRRFGISAALMTLVIGWAFLQTQSWTPESWHHPIWKEARDLPEAFAGSISIDPDKFPESLTRILSYIAFFLFAFVAGRDGKRARNILRVLGWAAAAYSFYGLVMQSTGLRMVLWYEKWAYQEFVTSTFVNKNSFATYAGLGLQVCIALLWLCLKRRPEAGPEQTPEKAAWLDKLLRQDILYLITFLVVLGALFLTGSRAGIASALAGSVVMLVALAINRRWKWFRSLGVAAVFLAVIVSYSFISGALLFDRLEQSQIQYDTPLRLNAYIISLRAIASNPWLGFGLGTFENAFRLYRDSSFPLWFQHAHNDYLELAIELGVPSALMYLTAIFLMISCCVQGVWKRKRHEIFPALGLGASVTVSVHSLVDFSMQIPAVAATYVVLLGLGVAQSWSSKIDADNEKRILYKNGATLL